MPTVTTETDGKEKIKNNKKHRIIINVHILSFNKIFRNVLVCRCLICTKRSFIKNLFVSMLAYYFLIKTDVS